MVRTSRDRFALNTAHLVNDTFQMTKHRDISLSCYAKKRTCPQQLAIKSYSCKKAQRFSKNSLNTYINIDLSHLMGKPTICIGENKDVDQLRGVTAKLISAFDFATRIVQFLFYLNPKFQASSSFLCLYRPVCVEPVQKPHCWFSKGRLISVEDNVPSTEQNNHTGYPGTTTVTENNQC